MICSQVFSNISTQKQQLSTLQFVSATEWTPTLLAEYRSVDGACFREELRYTDEELEHRQQRPFFEVTLGYCAGIPSVILLVYQYEQSEYLYLDTIAVKDKGQGIGSVVLQTLLDNVSTYQWKGLVLDTEHTNEDNYGLVEYYQKKGFVIMHEEDDNVTMLYSVDN